MLVGKLLEPLGDFFDEVLAVLEPIRHAQGMYRPHIDRHKRPFSFDGAKGIAGKQIF
ncbi:hypothetical protein SDC9_203788 [bioreactor metagenome]|uniref:Uncharacterized protein n=1 Tax=bioreactor metagenome TaxID=1076179 RepID=A0A645IZ20_9ZZZZ